MIVLNSFNSLLEVVEYFYDEEISLKFLTYKRWNNNITCPHCGGDKIYSFKDNKRYKCSSCYKQFTAKVGTIFEGSKIPLQKWYIAIYLLTAHKKGISSHQLSRDLKVTQKTAWFLLHRIRFALSQGTFNTSIGGQNNIVEIDETFIGGKNKNRHSYKKVESSQGRSYKDKVPILGMIERGGILKAMKVKNTQADTLQPIIENYVHSNTVVMTDEWWGYKKLHRAFTEHSFINHGKSEYVNGSVHTNTIEGFWSLFKRSIFGIYHSASHKHIQHYVDEAVFRYNTRKINNEDRLHLLMSFVNTRLKYNELIKR